MLRLNRNEHSFMKRRTNAPRDKREAALAASLKLIAEQGFQGAPMSLIADKARISVGTIYRYFSGKQDLINALYMDIKARVAAAVGGTRLVDIPVQEAFSRIIRDTIRYFIAHPRELHFLQQYENSPLIAPTTRLAGLGAAGDLASVFKKAREQALLKQMPLEMLGALIGGAAISCVKLHLSGQVLLDDATIDQCVAAIWDAVRA
jgi:AcrR family transcriptional regulator